MKKLTLVFSLLEEIRDEKFGIREMERISRSRSDMMKFSVHEDSSERESGGERTHERDREGCQFLGNFFQVVKRCLRFWKKN